MNPLFAPLLAGLLIPVTAMVPAALLPDGMGRSAEVSVTAPEVPAADWAGEPEPATPAERGLGSFAEAVRMQREVERTQQVRIEQRVIIRITPGPISRGGGGPVSRDPRRSFMADFDESAAPRFSIRRMAQCLPVAGIAGVQPDGPSRLILFMRDQRIVSAALEKGCNARDYYSGFLVERTSDGMICAARDKLLSRTGSNCALDRLRQLVEIDPDE